MVFNSGNLSFIRSIFSITFSKSGLIIFSMKGALDLRSATTRRIPLPSLPETMKSPSASPILSLLPIPQGLLSMNVLSPNLGEGFLFFLFFPFFNSFLAYSIFPPYMLPMYLLMLFFPTLRRFFCAFSIFPKCFRENRRKEALFRRIREAVYSKQFSFLRICSAFFLAEPCSPPFSDRTCHPRCLSLFHRILLKKISRERDRCRAKNILFS